MDRNTPILIDFDGIIKIGNQPAEDAKEFLQFISEIKVPSIIISNSTLRTSKEVIYFLQEYDMDFNIPALTAVDATLNYVKENYKKVTVFCNDSIKNVFKEFIDEENPEAVIVGDLGDGWTYNTMNEIFRKIYEGADFVAMQKNKFWKPYGEKLYMDAGAFISAIEYAASKEAVLIGKPSPVYFKSALKHLGFSEDNKFFMIGDDIETDINAAQKIGGKGILVYTGKTKFPLPKRIENPPDYEARNLREVVNLF